MVLKGATHVVFVFRSLLHWCFYVLVLYSKPVPVWFLPLEQVSFVSIQTPAIRYAYRLHSRYDFSIFRLIVTPLITGHCHYRYNAVNFLQNIHERHPIARPSGRGMGCLLWVQLWYSASVPAMMCPISCYIGPRFNGTWLYNVTSHWLTPYAQP